MRLEEKAPVRDPVLGLLEVEPKEPDLPVSYLGAEPSFLRAVALSSGLTAESDGDLLLKLPVRFVVEGLSSSLAGAVWAFPPE